MKRISTIVLLLTLCVYGLSASVRTQYTINEEWHFYKGDLDVVPSATTDYAGWQKVTLPHTWNVADVQDDPYGWYRGAGWYSKEVYIPESAQGRKVFLVFEAANQTATCYVNGVQTGDTHIGGYTPFTIDITDCVKAGTTCCIAVRVDNSHDENIAPLLADFVFYGGIYRDVHLVLTEDVHFDMMQQGTGVYIETPQVDSLRASVRMTAYVSLPENLRGRYEVVHTVYDDRMQVVGSVSMPLKRKNACYRTKSLTIDNPTLWDTKNPYLYKVVSEIRDNAGNVADRVENPLGLRWFRFDNDKGFFLNGQHVKLLGTNRHQDYQNYGNGVPDEMQRNDLRMIKDLGVNCIRISHYPHDPSVLEMCDRYGFVAFEEIPIIDWMTQSEKYLETCKQQITEMIRRDYNHPCIVAWNSSNESTVMRPPRMIDNDNARYERELSAFFVSLDEHIKSLDATRASMIVHCGDMGYNYRAGFHTADFIGYNKYEGWYENDYRNIWNVLPYFKENDKEHGLFLSEYGAGADYRIRTFDPRKFDHSVEYQVAYIKEHLKAVRHYDFVIGSTIWNFADFYSEGRGETQPHINNKGIVTADRRPKDSYFYFKANFSSSPMVAIPSQLWTRRGGEEDYEGAACCTQTVEVFANVPQVELFLNGRSLGVKPVEECSAVYDVPFVDGENRLYLRAADETGADDFLKVQFALQPYYLTSESLPFREIAVNVGSHFYYMDDDRNDYLWLPDRPYRTGSWGYVGGACYIRDERNGLVGSRDNIVNSLDEPLYQTQRTGLEAYRFDVPRGEYEVTLHFAELQKNSERCFHVDINGFRVVENLNLSETYGNCHAVSRRCKVYVEGDEGIIVSFDAVVGEAVLNGISVRKIY